MSATECRRPQPVARFTHKHNGKPLQASSPALPDPAPVPCPFCGHTAEVTIDWCGAGFRGDCYRCGASGPLGATPLEAAKHWNARSTTPRNE